MNIKFKHFSVGQGQPLFFILGPCVMESEQHTLYMAEQITKVAVDLKIPFIFKASFDKANRSSIHSYRGPGLDAGIKIFEKIKQYFDIPLLTDIHSPEQADAVADVVDILQIPAFLCRQTDLLIAAAKTGKVVNVKKGQFLSPREMENAVTKIKESGNNKIMLTERGTSFGYNNLVSDMRSIPMMQDLDVPVIFDGTHSLQLPGAKGHETGGMRQYSPHLTKAAVAAGADGIFMEVHNNPEKALSDSATQWPLDSLYELLSEIKILSSVIR